MSNLKKNKLHTGFLASIDFPRGSREKLFEGDLVELLIDNCRSRLSYNLLTLEPEFDRQTIPIDFIENLSTYLSLYGYKIGRDAAHSSLMVAAHQNNYHPVNLYLEKIEYLSSVKPIDIETIATDYLGTESNLYNQMLKMTLIAAVARVKNRGIKFDNCCVLVGKQGTGKSTFWRYLASDAFFADTWQPKLQDLAMILQRCWIFEIAELDRISPNSEKAATLKALLSSPIDTFRRPYGRSIGSYPRPSIMVSSCNRTDFLNDPTGSRRYWVINLEGKLINNKKVLQDRDRIWKAALLAYKEGMILDLEDKYKKEINIRNSNFEAEHPFYSRIEEWTNKEHNKYRFTTVQALVNSGCRNDEHVTDKDVKEAADCLRKLGYEKKQYRFSGRKPYYWFHPEWSIEQKKKEPRIINLPNKEHYGI
ncbi:virulence-associated E family protein [Prochlorococcus sp. AH-716-B23]|nr:virulence-associated E family protein [Prochlorococcus sp. AH-716-B23]